jgi:quercetin dioxygenase-like cupin family protein
MAPTPIVVDVMEMEREEVRAGRARNLTLRRLPLDTGVPGLVIEFSRVEVPDGYYTPRHRHNFDQIRYCIEGVFATGQGNLAAGECGYFPEGTRYGPQDQKGDAVSLTLQFQGASGERFLSSAEIREGYAGLETGVYKTTKPDGRAVNQDSYEAIWERHQGRKLAYPAPRYRHPVMMVSSHYRWLPDRARPGVETKHLGTFTEYRTSVGLTRLAPGAVLPAARQDEAEIRYVIDGAIEYGGATRGVGTYFYIPPGAEVGTLRSARGATFYAVTLPMVAALAAGRAEPAAAE